MLFREYDNFIKINNEYINILKLHMYIVATVIIATEAKLIKSKYLNEKQTNNESILQKTVKLQVQ